MKLSQCAAFVAIADTGSFTNAARALGISQSAVSHAIAGLEAALGATLMERDRAGVRLTDAGLRALEPSRVMVVQAERVRQVVRGAGAEPEGPLRIGTSQSFAARLLPAVMSELHVRYPLLEINLREGSDTQITQWLRGNGVDVGIVTLPKRGLTTVPLLQDELVAVVPTDHPEAGRPPLRIDQLATDPFLMPVGGVEVLVRAAFRTVGLEPGVGHHVRDINALLAMVGAGLGVTVLPRLALPLVLPDVRLVPLSPPVVRHLGLGMRLGSQGSPAVEAFVEAARPLALRSDQGRRPVAVR
ncbi:LysR family transcriptional regulator (plasmid) [Streptomyces sp. NBC_01003]|uniref:LysR family transcriptional regulator n=1 Tax=Streptomyces sp. NBC_01003 TaxID=2903714 RepID=UPI002F90D4A7|nr:LysR family transcriptional regulator [Streptomyces sp. NBC_01003]